MHPTERQIISSYILHFIYKIISLKAKSHELAGHVEISTERGANIFFIC